ncbi:hypothetical protein CVT26_007046 [Gymnopilus dilepis]|uniref:Uncharacterized protein n=1 Tax=Gymnopilus dilepis TaxID=231916 RepID=A0A409W001_9AGAR|nr:hypothetical protein CVT26_007046 [Gymnopilus dilepis]
MNSQSFPYTDYVHSLATSSTYHSGYSGHATHFLGSPSASPINVANIIPFIVSGPSAQFVGASEYAAHSGDGSARDSYYPFASRRHVIAQSYNMDQHSTFSGTSEESSSGHSSMATMQGQFHNMQHPIHPAQSLLMNDEESFQEYPGEGSELNSRGPEPQDRIICRQTFSSSQDVPVERFQYQDPHLTASIAAQALTRDNHSAILSPTWSSVSTSSSSIGSPFISEALSNCELPSPSPLSEDDEDDDGFEVLYTPPPSPAAVFNDYSQLHWSSQPGALMEPTSSPQPRKPAKKDYKLIPVVRREVYRGLQFVHVDFEYNGVLDPADLNHFPGNPWSINVALSESRPPVQQQQHSVAAPFWHGHGVVPSYPTPSFFNSQCDSVPDVCHVHQYPPPSGPSFTPQGLTAVDQNTMSSGPSTAIRGHSSTTVTQNPFPVMPQRQHPSHPIQTQSMTAEGSLQGYSGLRSGYHSGGSEPDQNLRCREPSTAASLFSSQDGPVERIEYQGLCFPASTAMGGTQQGDYSAILSPTWSSISTSSSPISTQSIQEVLSDYDLPSPSQLSGDDEEDDGYEVVYTPPPSPAAVFNNDSQLHWSSQPGAVTEPTSTNASPRPRKPVKKDYKLVPVVHKEVYRGLQFVHVNFEVYSLKKWALVYINPLLHSSRILWQPMVFFTVALLLVVDIALHDRGVCCAPGHCFKGLTSSHKRLTSPSSSRPSGNFVILPFTPCQHQNDTHRPAPTMNPFQNTDYAHSLPVPTATHHYGYSGELLCYKPVPRSETEGIVVIGFVNNAATDFSYNNGPPSCPPVLVQQELQQVVPPSVWHGNGYVPPRPTYTRTDCDLTAFDPLGNFPRQPKYDIGPYSEEYSHSQSTTYGGVEQNRHLYGNDQVVGTHSGVCQNHQQSLSFAIHSDSLPVHDYDASQGFRGQSPPGNDTTFAPSHASAPQWGDVCYAPQPDSTSVRDIHHPFTQQDYMTDEQGIFNESLEGVWQHSSTGVRQQPVAIVPHAQGQYPFHPTQSQSMNSVNAFPECTSHCPGLYNGEPEPNLNPRCRQAGTAVSVPSSQDAPVERFQTQGLQCSASSPQGNSLASQSPTWSYGSTSSISDFETETFAEYDVRSPSPMPDDEEDDDYEDDEGEDYEDLDTPSPSWSSQGAVAEPPWPPIPVQRQCSEPVAVARREVYRGQKFVHINFEYVSEPTTYGGISEGQQLYGNPQVINNQPDIYQSHRHSLSFSTPYDNIAVANDAAFDTQNFPRNDIAFAPSHLSNPRFEDSAYALQPESTGASGFYHAPRPCGAQGYMMANHGMSNEPSEVWHCSSMTAMQQQLLMASEGQFHPPQSEVASAANAFREHSGYPSGLTFGEPETNYNPRCRQGLTAHQHTSSQIDSAERHQVHGQQLAASIASEGSSQDVSLAALSPTWSYETTPSSPSSSDFMEETFSDYDLRPPSPMSEFEEDDSDEDEEDYEDLDTPPPSPPATANSHGQSQWSPQAAEVGRPWYKEDRLSKERRRMEEEAPPNLPPRPVKNELRPVTRVEVYRGQRFVHVSFQYVSDGSAATRFIYENPGGH